MTAGGSLFVVDDNLFDGSAAYYMLNPTVHSKAGMCYLLLSFDMVLYLLLFGI